MKKKVMAAMSGGVDSSVAAYLLKEEGYDVTGVIMQIWQDEDICDIENRGGCCGFSAVNDARAVADKLGIPFYVLNFKDVFKKRVIDYFTAEYYKGRTPNPCIACNRFVKWESLLAKAKALGMDYMATGHYADIVKLNSGRYTLRLDRDNPKDQTYALYSLTQPQLSSTLTPLSGIKKDEVRKIAAELSLNTADKPDSQEICFIPDNDYGAFLEQNGKKDSPPGLFLDEKGNVLGKHRGIIHYTVGQRKNLGMSFGKPMFVKHISAEDNTVTLCGRDEVYFNGFQASDINYMALEDFDTLNCLVKIRYSQKLSECKLTKESANIIKCEFDTPGRAVTPGQAAVFYDFEGNMICGGIIERGF